MPFKTILSVTGADQGYGDIELAAHLCSQTGAHLTVLVLGLAMPPPLTDFGPPVTDGWLMAREEDMKNLEARGAAISEFLRERSLTGEAITDYPESGLGDDIVGLVGRYSDVTVIGPDLSSDPQLKRKALEGALFASGGPLLLLPRAGEPTLAPKRVLVGWDSGIEASRAVREALEMMQGAEQVTVAIVDPEPTRLGHGEEPGADLATYLARHGIKVTVNRLPREGHSTADVLRRHAVDTAADMIVLGAYGHSRLRDWIFGGVTKSMIAEATVPVFMAR